LDSRDVTNCADEALSMSKKMSLQSAQALVNLRLTTMVPNLPLRLRPVIVLAEDEVSYRVTTLGVAEANELSIVR